MPIRADEGARGAAEARRAESLRALIEVLAHALRTQLGTVANSAGLLRVSGNDLATLATVAEILDRTARSATTLIADMEELARLQAGLDLLVGPIDGESMARRVVVDARPAASQRGVELKVAPIAGPTHLLGDETRLRQALGRLVAHAADQAKSGSTVAVYVEVTESSAAFVIEDHGPPIPPDQRPWLFDIDGRRAPCRRRGGMGLGLAIASEIVRAHGGTVRCEPAEHCTALFRILLPHVPLA